MQYLEFLEPKPRGKKSSKAHQLFEAEGSKKLSSAGLFLADFRSSTARMASPGPWRHPGPPSKRGPVLVPFGSSEP